MRNAVIALALLCVVLVLFAFKKGSAAARQAEAHAAAVATLSNKLAEVETRMVLTQAISSDLLTNLQGTVGARMRELGGISNRLAQAVFAQQSLQKDLQTCRADSQLRASRLAELEGSIEPLQQQVSQIRPLEDTVANLKSNLAFLEAEKNALLAREAKARAELAELAERLRNPDYLRIQADKLDQEAALARKLAKSRPELKSDRRARLELQPDGSVTVTAPTNRVALQNKQNPRSK